MAEELTLQQRQAVENRGGALLVAAAAGSGKTKVLVDRLMGYLMDPADPANIDDFLMITYTKAAATELRGKIAAKISQHLARHPENRHLQRQLQRLYLAKISTVHGFCGDLLREYAYELDIPGDFRVADEEECAQLRQQSIQAVLEEAYANGLEDAPFRAFVDTQGLGRDDRLVPEIVLQVYNSARCHLDPEQWLDHCLEAAALEDVTDAAQTVWGQYLLEDLRQTLQLQLEALNRCLAIAREDTALSKVAAVLEGTVSSMELLAQCRTWDQVVEHRTIAYGKLIFPKKIAQEERCLRIKSVRNTCKDALEKKLKIFCDPSAQVLSDLAQTELAIQGLVKLTRAFARAFQSRKRRRRVLDFSDLEHCALDLLLGTHRSAPTRIAAEVGSRFREVLVDEYQDSNGVQDAIFSALTGKRQNIFLVGDVKQSIYQFRLADPGIFLEKYHRFRDISREIPGQGRKVLLSRNFRSGAAVLEAANDVFRRCMSRSVGGLDYGDAEALQEGIPHEPLGEPEVELAVLEAQDDAYGQEAGWVAQRIAQLLDGSHMVRGDQGLRPIQSEDIVILLRSPGSVGQEFQDALSARGIPSSLGGGRNLLETGEIGVLRSLLQVISNPRQDIPLLAVLASPIFGFSADDLASIRAKQRSGDFYQALLRDDSQKSREFLEHLDALRRLAQRSTLAQLLEEIFCRTRMDSLYAAMDGGLERSKHLREFYSLAVSFEAQARRDLTQFLEHLELLEERGLRTEESGGGVSIMSVHKSKGLEFPVVFLSALARSFNRESLRAAVLCDGTLGLGLSAVDAQTRVRYPTIAKRAIVARASRESISEELRVLYVAMTRARDRLIMTYAAKSPEKELAEIAWNSEIGGTTLLSGTVTAPGQWVLMEAMFRTEAGALFQLADARPEQTHLGPYPWKITVHQAQTYATERSEKAQESAPEVSPETVRELREFLSFTYGHIPATTTASKQTATQLKGRYKDQEAAEAAKTAPRRLQWRRPNTRAADHGTAVHSLMQYLDFAKCGSLQGVREELERLEKRGVLKEQTVEDRDISAIFAFFRTNLGRRIQKGEVLREFKFSILDDAGKYDPEVSGEEILLQGVVDCALIEPDGITVVDFKTDAVTASTVEDVARSYRPQVDIYAEALRRIYQMPIKGKYLYFFRLSRLVAL